MARVKAEYLIKVNWFAQIFLNYTLEQRPISRASCWTSQKPCTQSWKILCKNSQLTEPTEIHAKGFFGPTTTVCIYPREEMIRTPDNRVSYILPKNEKHTVGAIIIYRKS